MSTPHALAVNVSTYGGLTVYCSGNVFAAITVLFTVFGLLSFMVIYLQWRIQRGGVQGVQTPALLFRCPFSKRTCFENMSLVVTVFS